MAPRFHGYSEAPWPSRKNLEHEASEPPNWRNKNISMSAPCMSGAITEYCSSRKLEYGPCSIKTDFGFRTHRHICFQSSSLSRSMTSTVIFVARKFMMSPCLRLQLLEALSKNTLRRLGSRAIAGVGKTQEFRSDSAGSSYS